MAEGERGGGRREGQNFRFRHSDHDELPLSASPQLFALRWRAGGKQFINVEAADQPSGRGYRFFEPFDYGFRLNDPPILAELPNRFCGNIRADRFIFEISRELLRREIEGGQQVQCLKVLRQLARWVNLPNMRAESTKDPDAAFSHPPVATKLPLGFSEGANPTDPIPVVTGIPR